MYLYSEEDAEHLLEMPVGKMFTSTEYSVVSGRSDEECAQICEDLAHRGHLFRVRRAGVPYYHMLAEAHGIWEYNLLRFGIDGITDETADYTNAHAAQWGTDRRDHLFNAETPFYYAVPVSADVVKGGEILPYDDYEKIVARNSVFAVSPCQCRLCHEAVGTHLDETHPLETCISTGEMAEYYIENGLGREISKQEALDILHGGVEAGLVIQSAYTKDSEIICQCHGDCCDILQAYVALGGDFGSMPNVSHYNLEVDTDICLKCGACAERCPLFAVTMDEETGYPVVDQKCVRCGQCAYVCPAEARKLVQKDESEILELPQSMLDDYNLKAAYRISHNMVY